MNAIIPLVAIAINQPSLSLVLVPMLMYANGIVKRIQHTKLHTASLKKNFSHW